VAKSAKTPPGADADCLAFDFPVHVKTVMGFEVGVRNHRAKKRKKI